MLQIFAWIDKIAVSEFRNIHFLKTKNVLIPFFPSDQLCNYGEVSEESIYFCIFELLAETNLNNSH